jgi:hypothetical protein
MTKFESKKFTAIIAAMGLTSLFVLSGMVLIVLFPVVASSIVNLVTTGSAALNGAMGIYLAGQSFVDWKIHKSE